MKKMNKVFLAGTAFAVTTASALSLSGCCVPLPQPSVYGPPSYFETIAETSEAVNPTVYGPPENIEVPAETSVGIEIETDFTVEDEILEDVYGPPEWFD